MQSRDVESQSDTNQRENEPLISNTTGAYNHKISSILKIKQKSAELMYFVPTNAWSDDRTKTLIDDLIGLLLKESEESYERGQEQRGLRYSAHSYALKENWESIKKLRSEIEQETISRWKKIPASMMRTTASFIGTAAEVANSVAQQVVGLAIYMGTPAGSVLGNVQLMPIQGVGETATPQETTTTGSLMENSTMLPITDGSDTAATSPSTTPTMSNVGNVGSTGWRLDQTPYNHPSWAQTVNYVGYGSAIASIILINVTPTVLNWLADLITRNYDTLIGSKLTLIKCHLQIVEQVLQEINTFSTQDITSGIDEIPVKRPQISTQAKETVVNEKTKPSSPRKSRSKSR
ncbi:hypothetical protein [Anabaena azotica]|uniref:Uncharacterized protein n=1 Tax=Anabaena azotica FACHB-119 TaxID=947527 RepID=A0ABR8D730_9NOST|nr:hypothetical protein [Anabaena azotica]MBD2502130.1 hypothetical protein [Anabaena azotica FACHB-119]